MKQQHVINGLKYIAASPPKEHGGFAPETVEIAKGALALIKRLNARNKSLQSFRKMALWGCQMPNRNLAVSNSIEKMQTQFHSNHNNKQGSCRLDAAGFRPVRFCGWNRGV